jgi:hypothetical protein
VSAIWIERDDGLVGEAVRQTVDSDRLGRGDLQRDDAALRTADERDALGIDERQRREINERAKRVGMPVGLAKRRPP